MTVAASRTLDNSKDVARQFPSSALADSSITAEKLAPGAVESADVADGSITTAKLAALAVTGAKIAAGTISTGKFVAGAIATADIAAGAIAASAGGRALMADGFFDSAATTAKFAAGAIAASAGGRALMADGFFDAAAATAKFAAGAIPASRMANGAAIAALLSAGLGASAAYDKTTSGAQTTLAADAVKDRACLLVAVVTESFANGDGAQPTFTVGETAAATKFFDTTAFADATVGTVLVFAGINLATKNLIVTGVAATGATSTGAIALTVIALPTS